MTQTTPPTIKVKIERGEAKQSEFSFTESFNIGRDENCQIQLRDQSISRIHAEVYYCEGHWWVRDLGSVNGTYIDGKKIDRSPLVKPVRVELGLDGPILSMKVEEMWEADLTEEKRRLSVTQNIKQYFSGATREGAGIRTVLIRQAFKRVQKRQKKKYYRIIAFIVFLLILSSGYAIKTRKESKMEAIDLFYKMKELELLIEEYKISLAEFQDEQRQKKLNDDTNQLMEIENDYDKRLDKFRVNKKSMSEENRLILQTARIFGECELNVPKEFVQEVKKFIHVWKSNNDLPQRIKRAKEKKYVDYISRVMGEHNLQPHFFYLALVESAFDTKGVGSWTRYGYAKGMWQFIPDTARRFNLHLGPRWESDEFDSEDERHDFEKSTKAAAKYIRYIYNTEAKASGLLVMASYNYGEGRVNKLVKKMEEDLHVIMPDLIGEMGTNPHQRNFWQLVKLYRNRIPQETYKYVLTIFSAAVIGQNPKVFGFKFDNPLIHTEELVNR